MWLALYPTLNFCKPAVGETVTDESMLRLVGWRQLAPLRLTEPVTAA